MDQQTERNKATVRRFNEEVIQGNNRQSLENLMDSEFINRTAPTGADNGLEGMWNTFHNILHPAFPDLQVQILKQIAEDDLVTTHKIISGTHTGTLMGIAPTGKAVKIEVIDIVRVKNEKYLEHWGVNTLPSVIQQLKG